MIVEISYGVDRAPFEVWGSFIAKYLFNGTYFYIIKRRLVKTHVVNFAPGSHGFIYDYVFIPTLPDPIPLNTNRNIFKIDFTLSGVDASIVASTDALFYLGRISPERETVKPTIINCTCNSSFTFH